MEFDSFFSLGFGQALEGDPMARSVYLPMTEMNGVALSNACMVSDRVACPMALPHIYPRMDVQMFES